VEVEIDPDGALQLTAGPLGVAPVYVATCESRIVGSWDPVDLALFASAESVSPAVVARLLTRRHRYSAETLFSQIKRVTAGATAIWRPSSGLVLRYPPPAAHVIESRQVRQGADPVVHFGRMLDRVVSGACEALAGPIAVELSGGLDSANVAASVAQASVGSILSGGLLVPGIAGGEQVTRRRTIVEHLGLHDVVVAAADHLPLAPGGPRCVNRPHYPDTDVYQEAFDVLRAALRRGGAHVVFTGYGGDEIMSRAPAERHRPPAPPRIPRWLDQRARDALAVVDVDCSPVTEIALPTLVVFAARHPAYLRAGLWPVAPFATPALSRFGRSLPIEWRTGKQILRQRLARIGLPHTVTNPRRPESFGETMNLALRRHAPELLADMLDRSVLTAQGFVRRTAVERLYRRARDGRSLSPLVYDMLSLDIGIRSMCAGTASGGETWCAFSTPKR
jgi:asparagine synthase (glutamine-hydrolysing)